MVLALRFLWRQYVIRSFRFVPICLSPGTSFPFWQDHILCKRLRCGQADYATNYVVDSINFTRGAHHDTCNLHGTLIHSTSPMTVRQNEK
jgi:hypothetical protein